MGDAISANRIFMIELRKMSVRPDSCDDHVVAEWAYVGSPGCVGITYCICETRIEKLFLIKNKLNGNTAIIGCECIKRWNVECEVSCDTCSEKFGRNAGITRACKGDLTCKKCKARKKVEAGIKSKAKRALQLRLDKPVPFGKYKGQPFHVLIADVGYCHFLIRGTWLNGATRELLEGCYSAPGCREGMMYAGEGVYVTCPGCEGSRCLLDSPDLSGGSGA